jgi:hypothetical protein
MTEADGWGRPGLYWSLLLGGKSSCEARDMSGVLGVLSVLGVVWVVWVQNGSGRRRRRMQATRAVDRDQTIESQSLQTRQRCRPRADWARRLARRSAEVRGMD